MGREATTTCIWRGKTASAKILLEAHKLILRSPFTLRIPRSDLTETRVAADDLVLTVGGEPLVLRLGGIQAERWASALSKPLPSLASKMGINASEVYVVGDVTELELVDALRSALAPGSGGLSIVITIADTIENLERGLVVLDEARAKHMWCVYPKGGKGAIGDDQVRRFMRQRGYMDTKACAVSDRLTATRYSKR